VKGESAPTGAITNPQNTFFASTTPEFGNAIFLFATENGTVGPGFDQRAVDGKMLV